MGAIAVVMPASRAWPQFVRIAIRKDTSGVSVLAWTMVVANFTIWTVYGVVADLPVLIAANALAGVGAAGVLISLGKHGTTSYWLMPLTVTGAIAAALALNEVGGPTIVISAATALAICMFLPQVYTVFKQPPTGVSPVTWWLGIAAGVVWGSYGFLIGQPEIAAPHLVMTPCAIAILWRIYSYGRSSSVELAQ